MGERPAQFYEFGSFRVDAAERVLMRDQQVVPLTPKVFDILLALVQHSGHIIEKDELMKRVWPDSFVEDGNLTQNISLLRKALGDGTNGHRYIETVARRGYRFVADVRSVNLDPVITEGAEVPTIGGQAQAAGVQSNIAGTQTTQQPIKTDGAHASVERLAQTSNSGFAAHAPISRHLIQAIKRHKRAMFFGLAALIIAAGTIAYFASGSKAIDASSKTIDSIAVLPFVYDTADKEMEYFNDEITESLINNLSQLPKLRVVPRSMVFNYKGREVDLRKIGSDLGVRAVLTGRVHRRDDTLSIQAELIDVASVSQIWGQHYDRRIADVLLIQEEISREIFENLRLKLSLEEKKQLEAHRLYMTGRNYWNKRTPEALQQGIEYFQQAIEVDPTYPAAYAGLADCYNMLVVYGVRQPKEAFPAAKQAAEKALELDETLAEAHTSLAFIKFRWNWERLEAEREFQLAIKYKPGYAPAHQWYSSYLVAMERFDEAIAEAKRTQELESLSFITNSHLAWILYLAGQYDQAIEHCRRLLEVDQNFFPARRYLGLAYEQKGMYGEAIAELQKGVKLSGSPLMLAHLGHAYAVSGRKSEARSVLSELKRLTEQRYVSPYTVAAIYAGLGEKDQVFTWLEKAYRERDMWLMNLKIDPVFRDLRSDRRFVALLSRIGLA